MFFYFLMISVPVFYIIGVVSFISWLVRGSSSRDAKIRKSIADDVTAWASFKENSKFKSVYLSIAKEIAKGRIYSTPQQVDQQPTVNQSAAAIPAKPSPAAIQPSKLNQPIHEAFKSLENINILLYVGAFLVVVSAGIFVGVNYGSLTGVFKTTFLGIFASTFYLLGLCLYLWTKKLKPAGITFNAIGLILAPLVGLAAFNFIYLGTNGDLVWFITSIVSFALYLVSLLILRKNFTAYFLSFMALSLIESSVNLLNPPTYYLAWVMGATAVTFLLLSRSKKLFPELADSLGISANILLPASIISSIVFAPNSGMFQFGVNLLLAAFFYLISSKLAIKHETGTIYFALSLGLLPLACYFMFKEQFEPVQIAMLLSVVSWVYLGLRHFFASKLQPDRLRYLTFVAGLTVLLSSFLVLEQKQNLIILLVECLLLNLYATIRYKETPNLVFSLVAYLWLPFVIFNEYLVPRPPKEWLALTYVGLSLIVISAKRFVLAWQENAREVMSAAYITGLVLAVFYALSSSSDWWQLLLFLLIGSVIYWLSYVEKSEWLVALSAISVYFAFSKLVPIAKFGKESYSSVFMFTGMTFYLLGHVIKEGRGKILRGAGIVGPYFGAIVGYPLGRALQPIFSLAAASGLTYFEAQQEKNDLGRYLAAAVGVLTLTWFYDYMHIDERQVYMITWAAYFGIIGYLRHLKSDFSNRDWLVIVSLGFLTIPLFNQTTGINGPWYALLLFIESIILIFAGIAMHYKLVMRWGVAALVVNVAYQLRDFLYQLPKWIISGAVGLVILGLAVYLLSKRKEE